MYVPSMCEGAFTVAMTEVTGKVQMRTILLSLFLINMFYGTIPTKLALMLKVATVCLLG